MKRNKFSYGVLCIVLVCGLFVFVACGSRDFGSAGNGDAFFGYIASFNPARAENFERAISADMAAGSANDGLWVAQNSAVTAPAPTATAGGATQVEWEDVAGTQERHLIQTASVEMETEDFDDTVATLRQLPDDVGGYIESEMLTTRGQRRFTIVMRVPAASFDSVLAYTQTLADVRSTNQRAEDVTDRFYDLAGNLETRRIEEERLLALIEEAEDIHEILMLESRLSNTRQTIESYLASLNRMAGQIAFSTITVTLIDVYQAEVVAYASPTLGNRIGGAFGDSVDGVSMGAQNLVVFLAGAIIPLAIFGVFAFAVYKLVRYIVRRVRRKREA